VTSAHDSGDAAYWKVRQDRLGITTHGETLQPNEIIFCERLGRLYNHQELREAIEWLRQGEKGPDGLRYPQYDFTWLALDGTDWELKSPVSPDYSSIKRRLRDDIRKGKTRFIVDLGRHPLTPGLAGALAKYAGHRGIRLAVLSDDGRQLYFAN